MLPPVLEVYVLWHPGDARGEEIAEELVQHFHGTVFSGLIGGAVEVYVRSKGWRADNDAPRPIPFSASALPGDMKTAQFIAVVPILGNELADAVGQEPSPWRDYISAIVKAESAYRGRVGIFPYRLDPGVLDKTALGDLLPPLQLIAANPIGEGETPKSVRCRDLTQGLAQLLSRTGRPSRTGKGAQDDGKRLTVFISHTKRNTPGEGASVGALIDAVRDVIKNTRLGEFFDSSDLQPGEDWDEELRRKAATSALLSIRTDLYASRQWCQREVLIAKREGMPVIIMDALGDAEERGSFLMDHVPRVAARTADGRWKRSDIHRGLNLLVDECLKRALWRHQERLAQGELDLEVSWWAPHAPEPVTLSKWMQDARRAGKLPKSGKGFIILHPDPPLGTDEKSVLEELLMLSGIDGELDVITPRLLAARAG
jgi:hypothetical protein